MLGECYMRLKPYEWIQSLSNYQSIGVEGRRLMVNSKIEAATEINLSSGENLSEFNFNLLIFDDEPSKINNKPLERGFGLLVYYPSQAARDAYGAQDAFVGGWFCIRPKNYDELWNQIRQGGYADCWISLEVGPVVSRDYDWLWDVAKQRALFITTFTIDFKRLAAAEKQVDERRVRRKY